MQNEYRFTFGQKHRHEPHPIAPWVHPDGWLTIFAPDTQRARKLAESIVGEDGFSMQYGAATTGRDAWPREDIYPRDELHRATWE